MAPNYASAHYWNERYKHYPIPFDWYVDYHPIQHFLLHKIPVHSRILVVGCGNSLLSENLYEDGFQEITNVDVSSVVIDQMEKRYKDTQFADMKFIQGDCQDLPFRDQSFDVVIDKGTFDCIVCHEDVDKSTKLYCSEVNRVLSGNGLFLVISHGNPEMRLRYVLRDEYPWKCQLNASLASLIPRKSQDKDSNKANNDRSGGLVSHILQAQAEKTVDKENENVPRERSEIESEEEAWNKELFRDEYGDMWTFVLEKD